MKRSIVFAIVGILASIGCSAKEPFMKKESMEVSAKVVAVDSQNRLLSLSGPAGTSTILCGPEIVNFPQIQVGDEVKVTYTAALAASITKSKAQPVTTLDTQAGTAPEGSKPAAMVGATVTTTVLIESVDTSFDTVSFKRPDGFSRTIAVESPEGKKFIRTLKKGDKVDVAYTEALAIAVVPATK